MAEAFAWRPTVHSPTSTSQSALVTLVYELLDAHADTASLALAPAGAEQWENHLEYLGRLQRCGREVLAGATGEADPALGLE